ncbi:MAG TPA: hypothetical protein VK821_08300, partial [Dehalococcoidia bacterium]|nr:hypothetical protein [Dehalococcoidia bacterium]
PDDGVYSAGSLILLDSKEAVEQIGRLSITAVKSHPGCAAGAVLAERRELPASQGDAIAVEQVMLLARTAGVRYAGASAVDPKSPHGADATLIFLDVAARRSLLRAHLPGAFYMSGAVYPAREALIAEALLSVTIAVDAAGDSMSRFNRERPFTVAFIAKDRQLLDEERSVFEARLQAVMPVDLSERVQVCAVRLPNGANVPAPNEEHQGDSNAEQRTSIQTIPTDTQPDDYVPRGVDASERLETPTETRPEPEGTVQRRHSRLRSAR